MSLYMNFYEYTLDSRMIDAILGFNKTAYKRNNHSMGDTRFTVHASPHDITEGERPWYEALDKSFDECDQSDIDPRFIDSRYGVFRKETWDGANIGPEFIDSHYGVFMKASFYYMYQCFRRYYYDTFAPGRMEEDCIWAVKRLLRYSYSIRTARFNVTPWRAYELLSECLQYYLESPYDCPPNPFSPSPRPSTSA